MQSHIGCICLAFLQCVFSKVSSNCLPERMQSHIGCICLASLPWMVVVVMEMNHCGDDDGDGDRDDVVAELTGMLIMFVF